MALIEVLAALLIFAAMLVVMNRSVAIGLAGLNAAEREAEAVDVAQSILAEAGVTFPLADGSAPNGTIAGLTWTAKVEAYRPPAAGVTPTSIVTTKAYWVGVRVSWKEPRTGKEKSLALRSIKLAGGP